MIRKSLNKKDTKTAVNALVTPHLDYGNALLFGINGKYLRKLRVAQNTAAQLIEKHDQLTHIRKELNWLPISSRIDFKLLNMTRKALNDETKMGIALSHPLLLISGINYLKISNGYPPMMALREN